MLPDKFHPKLPGCTAALRVINVGQSQDMPVILPDESTSIFMAREAFGSPGMSIIAPEVTTINPAPTERDLPDLVLEAARTYRASLKNPPKIPDEYLAELEAQGRAKSASTLRDLTTKGIVSVSAPGYLWTPSAGLIRGPPNVSPK